MAAVDSHVVPINRYQIDLETSWQAAKRTFGLPKARAIIIMCFTLIAIPFPSLIVVGMPFICFALLQKPSKDFPARAPTDSHYIDKGDPSADPKKKFNSARGEVYLGFCRKTLREVWLSWNDLLTHIYMLGATGSGKTEAIWALLANFCMSGSGFTIGDGKGTIEFMQQGWTLCRRLGCEEDYFAINFMPENSSPEASHLTSTNKMNPLAEGSSADLTELMNSLGLSGDAGNNAYFEDNAAALIQRSLPAIIELRDNHGVNVDFSYIGQSLPLRSIYELSQDPRVSLKSRRYISGYLDAISFQFTDTENFAGDPSKQEEGVIKVHGQFISHFNKLISSMSIQYGNVYLIDHADLTMKDVTRNRRNLIFTLPSLSKSTNEIKLLGKVMVTSQKNAMAIGLGNQFEGTREETIASLPSNHTVPYAAFFDEWGFYGIEGMAMLPAQIRGLFFSGGFFAQDYGGTEAGGERDAEQIFANTRVKLFGALEDIGKTWTKIRELVGEVRQAVMSGYRFKSTSTGGRWVADKEKAEITHRAALEAKDLQKLIEGECFLAMRGKLQMIKFMYTGLKDLGDEYNAIYKIQRFTRIYRPTKEELKNLQTESEFTDVLFSDHQLFMREGSLCAYNDSIRKSSEDKEILGTKDYVSAIKALIGESELTINIDRAKKTSSSPPSSKMENDQQGAAPELQTEDDTNNETYEKETAEDDSAALSDALNTFSDMGSSQVISEPTVTKEKASPRDEDFYDPLFEETVRNKQAVIDGNKALPKGASILTEEQERDITEYMTEVNILLGVSDAKARQNAANTVNQVASASYYLAPPTPHTPSKSELENLEGRLAKLL